jgi:hypothetical protein
MQPGLHLGRFYFGEYPCGPGPGGVRELDRLLGRRCPLNTNAPVWYIIPNGVNHMINRDKERWKVLCEQAAGEQDPKKLHELIREINRLLEECQASLEMSAF